MPSKEQIYSIWAPADSVWSPWVKPVLFAFVGSLFESPSPRTIQFETDWPTADGHTAIVLDLPEEWSVLYGTKLAHKGYRPVPLYNAMPFPFSERMNLPGSRPASAVEVEPILAALIRETTILETIVLSPNAPPVFLLDADRRFARRELTAGVFDNRSVCFTTDFPSPEFLLNHGIRSVIVVQDNTNFAPDLVETLVRCQQAGIKILRRVLGEEGPPVPVIIKRPSFFSAIWFKLRVALGFHRGELGGFGGIVPTSSG
jgi:hypothetical protein